MRCASQPIIPSYFRGARDEGRVNSSRMSIFIVSILFGLILDFPLSKNVPKSNKRRILNKLVVDVDVDSRRFRQKFSFSLSVFQFLFSLRSSVSLYKWGGLSGNCYLEEGTIGLVVDRPLFLTVNFYEISSTNVRSHLYSDIYITCHQNGLYKATCKFLFSFH